MIVDDPLDLVFGDIFIRLAGIVPQTTVALKLEGFSITGSIKIKSALLMIAELERQGRVQPGVTTIVESSSGNLGVALSLICRRRGYRFVCVTDPNASHSSVQAMRAYGAEVVVVTTRDANGGYLETRLAYIRQLVESRPAHIWLNQYANAANKRAHYEATAWEILAEFPRPDWVFIGTGSTGTFMGCAEYFSEHVPDTRLVAVEPVGSVTFGSRGGRRLIPGIGASRRPELADDRYASAIVHVPEPDAIDMCHALALEHGLLAGGSTGSVIAGVRQMADAIRPGDIVVAISPDFGDRYLDTIYNRDWVRRQYGIEPRRLAEACPAGTL